MAPGHLKDTQNKTAFLKEEKKIGKKLLKKQKLKC